MKLITLSYKDKYSKLLKFLNFKPIENPGLTTPDIISYKGKIISFSHNKKSNIITIFLKLNKKIETVIYLFKWHFLIGIKLNSFSLFLKDSFKTIFPYYFGKKNYILKFKNKETPSNLYISTCKSELNEKYVIEFWDVIKDFHSLKPLEENIKLMEEEYKRTNNKELKKQINYWKKYGNKRVLISKEDFKQDYEIDKIVLMQ